MLDAKTETATTLRTPEWFRTATRWTQLTLAEDDPVKFDPDFWIDVFRRTRSNATCLSAGGYIAYYPSKVPLHYVSKFIGDKDPFGALVEGARSLDMHVMARVDPHAIHQDAADAHPEWIAVDKDGNPRRHWAYPDVWVTCAYGDYNNVFMPNVVKEIVREYDIDAVFANRWQGHGVCYCASCTEKFRAASGHDLPKVADANDPVWQAWTRWRRDVLTRMIVAWDEDVKAIRPHASFIPNMSGASLMEFDLKLIEKHCPFIVVDDQGRRGTESLWMAGRNGKRVRATFRERPVILITSIGPEEEHRWKDAVTTGPEMAGWITNGTAHGMLPWFTKFNGVVPDTRWVEPVADAFGLHADLEPVLGAMAPDRRDRDHRPEHDAAPLGARDAQAGRGRRPRLLPGARRGEAALRVPLRPDDDARAARRLQGRHPRQRPLPLRRAVRDARATTSPAAAASSPPSRPRPATRTATRATASASSASSAPASSPRPAAR